MALALSALLWSSRGTEGLRPVSRIVILSITILISPKLVNAQRLDAGSPSDYTDAFGNVWYHDRAYTPGSFGYVSPGAGTDVGSVPIGNSLDPALYQTARHGVSFDYRFDVPNGNYQVRLRFAEIYSPDFGVGRRIFSVSIQGNVVLNNLDIYALVGASTAFDKTFEAPVTNGSLDISFAASTSHAMVSAIEVLPIGLPDFTLTVRFPTLTMALSDFLTSLATVSFQYGFSSSGVNFSVTGLPTGVTATFSPNPLPSQGSSILTLIGDGTGSPGIYPVTIGATAGGITHQQNVMLVLSTSPDFGMDISPITQDVAVGASSTYQLTLTSVNSFASAVTLSVSGLPKGARATFGADTVSPPATSTLTITTSSTTRQGQYAITITGNGGGVGHALPATLIAGPSGAVWLISSVGSTGTGNGSVRVGPARNDGVNRLYVGTANTGRVLEYSWGGTQWVGPVDIGGSLAGQEIHNVGMGRSHNDGVIRLYAASVDGNIYELSYVSPGWTQATVGTPGSFCTDVAVGSGQNDGVNRVYATCGANVWEYTWKGTGWNTVVVGSVASGLSSGISIGNGRGDGFNRLYIASSASGNYEATFSGGTWSMVSMGDSGDVADVSLGPGRNDGVTRVYVALRGTGQVRELTWGGTGWMSLEINSSLGVALTHVYVSAGRNDSTNRVYSSGSDGNVYEFSWTGSGWTMNVLGGQDYLYGFHVGQGRNDGLNRVYGAAFNQVSEYTWTAASPDTTAPTLSLTSPTSGQTVSGAITVSATASDPDNGGVARVQFLLDGANLGAPVTTAPYSTAWNTTGSTNGPHTLSALAFDAAGNQGTAPNVNVTVSNPSAWRINAGGGAYRDGSGNVWSADQAFTGSFGYIGGASYSTSSPIAYTNDPTLYQSARHATTFDYRFTVPNGNYQIILRFAETYPPCFGVGKRVFNVSIQGTQVLTNFDVYALAGGNAAFDETFSTSVANGVLDINFTGVVAHAVVSALQVLPSN